VEKTLHFPIIKRNSGATLHPRLCKQRRSVLVSAVQEIPTFPVYSDIILLNGTRKRGQFGFGSVWTWVAIDADTKLVPLALGWKPGCSERSYVHAGFAHRIDSRIQLTTDGLRAYLVAVQGAFGLDVDFATLHRLYGIPEGGEGERRYTPPVCIGCKAATITGNPDRQLD
jgi:hypothetical protein